VGGDFIEISSEPQSLDIYPDAGVGVPVVEVVPVVHMH
jgi:hypothetical protein